MKPADLFGLWYLVYVSSLALIPGEWLLQMSFPLKTSFVWSHCQETAYFACVMLQNLSVGQRPKSICLKNTGNYGVPIPKILLMAMDNQSRMRISLSVVGRKM